MKILINETQIKHVLKSYINEIEKYTPNIDSPEDEENLEKKWGVVKNDPYKQNDPFRSLKNNDFYDDKLSDFKMKQKLSKVKNATMPDSRKYKGRDDDKPSDLSYLGGWKSIEDVPKIPEKRSNLQNDIDKLKNIQSEMGSLYSSIKNTEREIKRLELNHNKIDTPPNIKRPIYDEIIGKLIQRKKNYGIKIENLYLESRKLEKKIEEMNP